MRLRCAVLYLCVVLPSLAYAADARTGTKTPDWNRSAAAQYLDARQQWWMDWPKARRDHDTACISCHTALPYALARPSLHPASASPELSAQETQMLRYVVKRVTLWNEIQPFYSTEKVGPKKTPESRGTESVLNALVLARYDSSTGHLRQITRDAFQNMWQTQLTTGPEQGSWDWLNFHNAPWEGNESHYFGTTLAALAVGMAPEEYRNSPEIQPHLREMRRYMATSYDTQPLYNKIVLLWASSKLDGLLTASQRNALLTDIVRHQQADGGWSLASLGPWSRRDKTPESKASDGYATGITVLALSRFKDSQSSHEVKQGIAWLRSNQAPDGHWDATSLNKQHVSTSDGAKFMSDAATAFASLALSTVSHP